ncbi:MAG: transcription-repair coupling factor [Clostridia bacterium]|nr:transcription-repair coupling factor [Clostridia bacterium]
MLFLDDILNRDDSIRLLSQAVKNDELPLACTGLSSVHKSLFAAFIMRETKKKLTVITPDDATAHEMTDDLASMGVKSLYLPPRDYNLIHLAGYSREYEQARINTLSKLLDGDFDVAVFSAGTAILYTTPPEILRKSATRIKTGDALTLKDFKNALLDSGYVVSDIVEGPGQFSFRGNIVDVFSPDAESPYRIELWGDEVDSLSSFDISTQRRNENLTEIKIVPARELVFSKEYLKNNIEKILKSRKKISDSARENLEKDLDSITNDLPILSDRYIPLLFEKAASVFDYLEDTVPVLCEFSDIKETLKNSETIHGEDIKDLLEKGYLTSQTANIYLNKKDFLRCTADAVYFENFAHSSYNIPLKHLFGFNLKRESPISGGVNALTEDLDFIVRTGGTAVILCAEKKAAKLMVEDLSSHKIKATFATTDEKKLKNGVYVMTGGLSAGFTLPGLNFSLFTHRYLRSEKKRKKQKIENAKQIGSLDELKIGDYVVHAVHGIGVFSSIERITNDNITKDYIKIKYAGSDVLYVPVTQLDLVSKYIGAAEDKAVKLNKLGSAEWYRTKTRVRSAVRDMAKQLIELYSKRMSAKGYAFSPDTDLQNDFERRFEYEETGDQLVCVNEIKNDMERPVPMDRLLCGDVGFGKTEVALRAAFKCVSEGKQCAMLVPTTILASQHFNTVKRRFGELPIEVKMLSRFVSKNEQKKTLSGLKSGSVDMVIGTHRLISKDVVFKDIGLVIIDEEQRFGVAQKERLKKLYPFVDILTLSATPIPRTLNMAMSGLRDMSSIDEAPGDRYPVQTYVLEQDNSLLVDAMQKELRRGGQVYYLHNRVETINRTALRIKESIPSAKVAVAHGKMSEEELNSVWQKLIEHEIDILVCTTIIETGVDVPNVNTLIIENADRMGLSQLHQLRGRVGRSPRRAYAYFCFKKGAALSEVSSKRLEAIRQFTEFGSGFKIALRDLEIRGAGNILGGEQHGNMEAVGYDMYLKLLADAVSEEKGEEKAADENECVVDLNISAHIPENYISSNGARLGIYKRIANIKSKEDVSDVIDELCDRFGEPPKAVLGLIDIALLRGKAAPLGIKEISGTEKTVVLKTDLVNKTAVEKLSEAFGDSFVISALSNEPQYVIRLKGGQKQADVVKRLSDIL